MLMKANKTLFFFIWAFASRAFSLSLTLKCLLLYTPNSMHSRCQSAWVNTTAPTLIHTYTYTAAPIVNIVAVAVVVDIKIGKFYVHFLVALKSGRHPTAINQNHVLRYMPHQLLYDNYCLNNSCTRFSRLQPNESVKMCRHKWKCIQYRLWFMIKIDCYMGLFGGTATALELILYWEQRSHEYESLTKK